MNSRLPKKYGGQILHKISIKDATCQQIQQKPDIIATTTEENAENYQKKKKIKHQNSI